MSTNEEKKDSALGFLLPILLFALLAAGVYYLFGKEPAVHEEEPVAAVTGAAHHEESAKPAPATMMRESLKVKLPDGTELDAYKGGIEDKLVAFLNSDYKALGADSLKNTWFDFDNLNFNTASAEITAESQKQVSNIAAILKAFPAAKIKIGGYTDKVGDEAANKKLSGDRAKSVKAALDKAGAGAQVTDAEGYGSAYAKHPADAPEAERLTDRRVSVSVRL
jgi:outer membrane protein OmpA-like peptidoglycan-associated protein